MIKAVIFDMDGLLADTEPLHFRAWKKVFRKCGMFLSNSEYGKSVGIEDQYKKFVGIGDQKFSSYYVKKYRPEITAKEMIKEKRKVYFRLIENVRSRKGAKSLLSRAEKKFTVAVASSSKKDEVIFILKKLGMVNRFKVVVTGDGMRKKPFPDIYLKAAKRLQVKPQQCVAIEDTSPGVTAAKKAGMFCIATPHEFSKGQDFSKADMVVKNLRQITAKKIMSLESHS